MEDTGWVNSWMDPIFNMKGEYQAIFWKLSFKLGEMTIHLNNLYANRTDSLF